MSNADDTFRYRVVFNHERQYSIWRVEHPLPGGWTADGKEGTRDECLDHIRTVWTDIRPRSMQELRDARTDRN